MSDLLNVFISGSLVATISRTAKDQYGLTYASNYVETGNYPLTPVLPIGSGKYTSQKVKAFVEGLVPENPDTRREWARLLGTGASAFSLLSHMGLDCAGAVQFACPDDTGLITQGGKHVPVTDKDIGDRLRALKENEAKWTAPSEHWSLPGQQGKFALARVGDKWCVAHGAAATTHIFKPGIKSLNHQALIEHLTMQASRKLGLRTATTEMVEFDGEPSLVVTRFDRDTSGAEISRIHQVDFCQAMGRLPDAKYEQDGGSRPKELAAMLREVSTSPDVDVRRFSDAIMFNYVSGSPDGHAKNYSVIFAGRVVRLAPLYDLATGLPYYDQTELDLRTVAMSIGGRRRLGEADQTGWQLHADDMRLARDERIEALDQMTSQISGAFEESLDEADDFPGTSEVRARIMPSLDKHVESVRVRAKLTSKATPVSSTNPGSQLRGKSSLKSNDGSQAAR